MTESDTTGYETWAVKDYEQWFVGWIVTSCTLHITQISSIIIQHERKVYIVFMYTAVFLCHKTCCLYTFYHQTNKIFKKTHAYGFHVTPEKRDARIYWLGIECWLCPGLDFSITCFVHSCIHGYTQFCLVYGLNDIYMTVNHCINMDSPNSVTQC